MDNLTDLQLISLYLEGNLKAFDGITKRYAQVIYRFVFKLTNNSAEAHDITQETIIKIWKNIKKFDNTKSFKTWIFTIAQRSAIDFFRKRKNINFSALDNADTGIPFEDTIVDENLLADEIFEKNQNIVLVQNALETLSAEDKATILLHVGEGMTFDEIAEIVEKPMNTVKSQYRRALITLKKYIIKQNAPK